MNRTWQAPVRSTQNRLQGLRPWTLWLAALVTACTAASCLAAAVPIAPGVTAEEIRDEAGPWEVRVVRIERGAEQVALVTALGRGRLSGVEGLSRIIERESTDDARAVAAVNADFFRMANRPFAGAVSGVCIRNGELVTISRGRPGFFLAADGTPRIETTRTSGEINVAGRTFNFGALNTPDQGPEGAVQLFTEIGGWELSGGCLVAALEDGPLRSQGTWQATVTEVVPPGRERAARAGEVLIGARGAAVSAALLQARPGERVEIALQTVPFTAPMQQAIGGGPVLVSGGEIVAADQVRHPRTAIGFNDTEIVIVTVDGRQPGWSVGMNMRELAELMHRLGCKEAVNLDGGGSTTAWVRDRVVNRPSDGGERSVANALLVMSSAPTGPPALLRVLPASATVMPGAPLPVTIEVTDQWHNLLDVPPERIDAELLEQKGVETIAISLHDGVLTASGGPGTATLSFSYREAPEVKGTMELEVTTRCEAVELSPADLRLLPSATGGVAVRGYTGDGTRIIAPAEAIQWRIEGEGIEHLGDGRFRAETEGAEAAITAALGGMEASGHVRAAREAAVEDFSGGTAPGFRGIPDSVTADLSVLTEEFEEREISFCRMSYDLGEASRTRAAYMVLNRNLGEALAISLIARAEGRTAWVRLTVADGTGATHLLTATSALSPDEGWRRLTIVLPKDIPAPVMLQSVYVVTTADVEARGALHVTDIRAMVLQ